MTGTTGADAVARPGRAGTLAVATLVALLAGCDVLPGTPGGDARNSATAPAPMRLDLPETLQGLSKSVDRAVTETPRSTMEDLKREVGEPTSAVGWAYGSDEDEHAILVAGASGTVQDREGALDRAVASYRVSAMEPVAPGKLGGSARCGRGEGDDRTVTVCAWADEWTVGVVSFLSREPHGGRLADFHAVREELEHPAG